MDERGAYERIFNRLDLKYVPVHAMAGPMGGFESEEFLARWKSVKIPSHSRRAASLEC